MERKRTSPHAPAHRPLRNGEPAAYVRTDEHGVLRVADTAVSLDSVVIAFQDGHTPESIRQQYPVLTLEAVYGALTYYLANREAVDKYLRRQDDAWRRARRDAEEHPSPALTRLREMLRNQAAAAG